MDIIIETLRKQFPADRIEWRIQSCGKRNDGTIWARCLAYLDNRSVMERLDEAFPADWSHDEQFITVGNKAVCVAKLQVCLKGSVRTVCGSCEVELNKSDDIDPFKSASSGAMKRAGVMLGIGRYLYDLPETWAIVSQNGKYRGRTKDGTEFRWDAPDIGMASQASAEVASLMASRPAPAFDEDAAPNQTENGGHSPNARASAGRSWPKDQPVAADVPYEAVADAENIVCPFGKTAKGKTLGELAANDPEFLSWIADKFQPKLWNGKLSKKDIDLKNAARQLVAKANVAKANQNEAEPY